MGSEKECVNCSIINISRDSMGVEVYLQERIPPHLMLQFKIKVPAKKEPIKTTGILKWIKELKGKKLFVGGVELFNIDSEETRALLDYACDKWSEKEFKY